MNPIFFRLVQDKNICVNDTVEFLDAEGCFVSLAKVLSVRNDCLGETGPQALVYIEKFDTAMTVRQSDLLKLVSVPD